MSEFKKFILRGNVVDMAVGIIIGAAFGKIIKSFVADILMPPIGMALGGVDFTNLFHVLGEGSYATLEAAQEAGAVTVNYGLFINNIVDFLIIAAAIFVAVKAMNAMKKKEEEAPEEPKGPTQEDLLGEIRDLLKKK